MFRNNTAAAALIVILSATLFLSGCARLSIPAPAAPILPLPEPAVPDSTLTLPVAVEIPSADPGKNNALAGALRDFIKRQATKLAGSDPVNNPFLRRQIARAWEALQAPLPLSDNVSLLLDPRSLALAPLEVTGSRAGFVVSITARPKLIAGALPSQTASPPPSFVITATAPEKGFHLALATELSFDYLGKELTKKLAGTVYHVKGASLTVRKVRVFGSGDSVILAVGIKGTVDGTVYLTGTPVYDEAAKSLAVRDVEYTLETTGVLAKLADWVMHSELRDKIAGDAAWPMEGRVEEAKERLSRALNRDINPQVRVRGEIASLAPVAVGLTQNSIKAVLLADGMVEVELR